MSSDTITSITFPSAPNPTGAGTLDPFVAVVTPPNAYVLPSSETRLRMQECTVSPHPALPPIPAWGYGRSGHMVSTPGPLLEAQASVRSLIRWDNALGAKELPYDLVVMPSDDAADPVQNHLGSEGVPPTAPMHAPIGWLSTHLHGGHTEPESDGWPDHMIEPGETQRCRYANDDDNADLGFGKVGAALWYHDHAMDATRLHVYAGLAGAYLVRHPGEADLGLPTSVEEGEAVLIIQDRNVDVAGDGSVRLLHKTTTDTSEFFGPLTLVNGKLWPRMTVRGAVARLRIYNGSNARYYRLHVLDDAGAVAHARVLVIGTDGGLLWKARPLAGDGSITLAPGERIDLLVDLRGLAGQHLYLVNSAQAPFSGDPAPADPTLPHPDERRPYPQVMRLDIKARRHGGHHHDADNAGLASVWDVLAGGAVMNPAFVRIAHSAGAPDPAVPPRYELPHAHGHRLVLLSESDPPGHLQLSELVADPAGSVQVQLPTDAAPQSYSPIDAGFYGTVGIMPVLKEWEVWRFLNTTGDTHPMHIHQVLFQPLGAAGTPYLVDGRYSQESHSTSQPLMPDPTATGRVFEPHETTGWKDTVRIDPGQLVTFAVRFDRVGRYVYHCHMIEHEDNEMMRPFVVTPLASAHGISHH
ncbi:MAG TPA: hypothetical protein DEG88_06765 [Propionibacteriaceae bacterium]|nr:multicopper oxidase domain-containing protein [Micropruina sp.]HBY22984.1 hypothetical protein [Propionibacteriaceae bacterium]